MRYLSFFFAFGFSCICLAATPAPFVISGLSDTSVNENTVYISDMPYLDGEVAGAATYSLLTTIDPFSDLSDLPMFTGKNIIQILLIILQDDSEFFSVDANGVVSLSTPADFENPQDYNKNNVYQITLLATDEEGNRDIVSWHLTIIDQPAQSFSLSGINNASIYENSAYSSNTPTLNGGTIGTVAYSITGADAQLFSVNSSTGVVSLPLQDFENPADSNANNVYEITLTATDGDNNSASLSWTVTVLNQAPLNFTIAPITANVNEYFDYLSSAPRITGAFRNPLTYTLSGDDAGLFTVTSAGKVFLPAQNYMQANDLDRNNVYVATLTATDNDGNAANTAISVTIIDTPFDPGLDSDGDGVINMVEVAEGTDPANASNFKDTDLDGIPDALESDADNDNIINTLDDFGIDPYADNDNDFVPNYLDKTDRGDGIAAKCSDFDTNNICDYSFALDPWFDIDQDAKANHADIDSDQDLLPDILEGTSDTDTDTLPNFLDKDSDNDAVPDIIESGTHGLDGNADGIADIFELSQTGGIDANGDGIDDDAKARDFDQDGTADYLDKDSDNDRIPDTLEGTSSNDSDNDGIDDRFDVTNTGGFDFNQDGINDSLPMLDTNGDSMPDYIDNDSDGDGIGDLIESGASGVDSNQNSIDDGFESLFSSGIDNNADGLIENAFINSDNDSAFDYQDLDSDNDTLPDLHEAGGIDINEDALNDSSTLLLLPLPNDDNDNLPNYRDLNSNGTDFDIASTVNISFDTNADGMVEITADQDVDGIDTSVDNAPNQYGLVPIDSDNDGVSDNNDPDDDNDTISDIQEGDIDSDGDGIANRFDRDSDNDGISDYVESATPVKRGDNNFNGIDDAVDVAVTLGDDINADGVDDLFQAVDSDGDTSADFLDSDSDNDNMSDNAETSKTLLLSLDDDSDGIDNAFDVDVQNGTDANNDGINDIIVPLINTDADARPNYKDADSDNDHISDKLETSLDSDNDGISNHLDHDSDNDGISDVLESRAPAAIGDSNQNGIDDSVDSMLTTAADNNGDGIDDRYAPQDADKDGKPNYVDDDSDDDTLSDTYETSGLSLLAADIDLDGIDDLVDIHFTNGIDLNNDGIDDALVPIIDTDADGLPNYLDKDSDGDGFADGDENADKNKDGINDRLQKDGKVKASSGSGSTHPFILISLLAALAYQARKKIALIAIAFALSLLSINTHAEVIDVCRDYRLIPSNEKAFSNCYYAGAGFGHAQTDPDTSDSSWTTNDDNDFGYHVFTGLHFSRYFFAEVQFADLGKTALNNKHALISQQESIVYKANSAYLGYYLPMDMLWGDEVPITFFIKAGPSHLSHKSSSDFVRLHKTQQLIASTAIGAEWNITPKWTLRSEYSTYSAEVHYLSVSAAYWFGGGQYHYQPLKPNTDTAEPVAAPKEAAAIEPVIETVTAPIEEPAVVTPPAPVFIDDDNDGVEDTKDKCPKTAKRTRVNEDGCAIYTGYIQSLYGAFNSTDLTYTSYGHIDTIILLLRTYPDTRIEIQAHTDNTGAHDINITLSNSRALTVKEYMVSKGVASSRIQTKGYGETQPLGDNNTPEGRSKNRRIDFVILQP